MEQGTEEWFAIRCGKVTASKVSDVMAKTKSGWGAGRTNYEAQLISERLTGTVAESFSNAAMQWGNDTEPQARAAYEFRTDSDVEQVAFVVHPKMPDTGASPDGLVGELGMIEIKCPNTATHIATLLDQKVPPKYVLQMQWQMACTGRDWCDFVSFDPRLPESMRMFVKRLPRDDEKIAELEREIDVFLLSVSKKVDELTALYTQA